MRIKTLKNPKNLEEAQTFLWEPVEGFDLEPGFFTWTFFKSQKAYVQKKTKSVEKFLSMRSIQI
jgi:hypothetical protein